MMRRNVKMLTRMILIGFAVNAVIPSAAQAWMLCIGCDDLGVAIALSEGVDRSKACCPQEFTEGIPEASERPVGFQERHAEDCGCIDLTFEKGSLLASLSSPQNEKQPGAMAVGAPVIVPVPGLIAGTRATRGPPGFFLNPSDRTLFGQGSLLLI